MVEPRQNSCLAHELVSRFLQHGWREGGVVANLFYRAIPARKALVLRKVNKSVATLTNDAFDFIALMKHSANACLKRHDLFLSSFVGLLPFRRRVWAACLHYNVYYSLKR